MIFFRGVDLGKAISTIQFRYGVNLTVDELISKIEKVKDTVYVKGVIVCVRDHGDLDNYIILLLAWPLQKKIYFYKANRFSSLIASVFMNLRRKIWILNKNIKLMLTFISRLLES